MKPLLNEIDVLRDVCAKLEKAGIPYMLTGSLAMNYYAQPRMTRDIDIVVELGPADAARIISLFSPEYYISAEAVEYAAANEFMFNAIHNESVIKVDFIVKKSDEYRHVEFSRRERIKIGDFHVYMVSKEDLIISKLVWAKKSMSELQLRDIKNLLGTGYNRRYLTEWVTKLGLDDLIREYLV